LLPLAVFLIGVAWLGLSGAPDERGFWPILLAALAAGTVAARDSRRYCEVAVQGMAQPLVLTMIMAWLLAGVLGSVVRAGGLVETLADTAVAAGVGGGGFAVAAFLVTAAVSTATGTSLGTLILCTPVLYPVGAVSGTGAGVLIGAILGGATFGDNISPVSDTTIASATTQGADMGGVVRSRLKYALPAAMVAMVAYGLLGGSGGEAARPPEMGQVLDFRTLWVGLGPAVAIALLIARRHLVESLLAGAAVGLLTGLAAGVISPADIVRIDSDAYLARGLVLEGMERAIGISVFTILLMGVVAGVESSGIVDRAVARFQNARASMASAEWSAFAAVSLATLLTTHSVVAILAVGRIVREAGEATGLSRYRRANVLDLAVCTYPFLLPFFIPTILASSLTAGSAGMPRVSPLTAGLYNAHSCALLVILLVALISGWGRVAESKADDPKWPENPLKTSG